jgi:hypothetical protein
VFPDEPPLDRAVAPGSYPVDLAIAQLPDQQRVAALRVTFGPGTPTRFIAAGDYGVDAGLGCVMDAATAPLLRQAMDAVPDDANYYDAVIASQLADRDWLDHHPVADLPSNVIIVHSGWGDGLYTSCWGLDDRDQPLWLVTDFEVA